MKAFSTLVIILGTLLLSCDGIEEKLVQPEDIISLQLLDKNGGNLSAVVVGDGESVITVKAIIPENTDEKFKTIKFKTSDGTFVGVTADASSQKANAQGVAQTGLRLPLANVESRIYISAEISTDSKTYTAEKELVISKVNDVIFAELLNIDGSPLNEDILGDGERVVLIRAGLLVSNPSLNQITIETTSGTLLGVSGNKVALTPDADAVVTVKMRIPNTVDPIFINASVGSNPVFNDLLTIKPVRSYPETIFIEPQKITMALNETNSIKVFLRKNVGKVSKGLTVNFQAYQRAESNIVPVGRFTGIQDLKSDINGEVEVQFHTDTKNIDTSKKIILLAQTLTAGGLDTLSNSIEIDVE
ncbi:hypothetical protein [Rhodohalobacter sulfatireducens]|uniref:Major fimbrial subunit protein N-terminal domain-containing protein n=1 Tax=Rhodohalobacter sulfatireducens TaxID=2911366 RepID=A0ABS9KF94_9BACT|nr:hypothetical protein [Rhodohalobacter sulfatireducens]MCG2589516.1 hypothetical protein [Rhodohalobacter sulfatireducens]